MVMFARYAPCNWIGRGQANEGNQDSLYVKVTKSGDRTGNGRVRRRQRLADDYGGGSVDASGQYVCLCDLCRKAQAGGASGLTNLCAAESVVWLHDSQHSQSAEKIRRERK